MGDKITAKEVAVANNVPIIRSSDKDLENVKIAISEAKKIGYPVMLKAASGGGGRGMRVSEQKKNFEKVFLRRKENR